MVTTYDHHGQVYMKTQKITVANLEESRSAPKGHKVSCDNKGFTLVELIVVVAVLAILATMALPAFSNLKDLANVARATADIRTIDKAISSFIIDNNRPPTNAEGLNVIGKEGTIRDPWNRTYQYYAIPSDRSGAYQGWNPMDPEPTLNDDYDLYSLGADGANPAALKVATPPAKDASSDNIFRAGNGSTVQLGAKL